jgi:hypothetical protein
MMRRIWIPLLGLLVLLAPVSAMADTEADLPRLDPGAWQVVSMVRGFETTTDPQTREQLRVPVVTTVSRYSPGGVTDSDCTKTVTQSIPHRNYYSASPTHYGTFSYAYVELTSGCTGYVYWHHYQERPNWLGYFEVVAQSDPIMTYPGETDYSLLTRYCTSLTTSTWRGEWFEYQSEYTQTTSLDCH